VRSHGDAFEARPVALIVVLYLDRRRNPPPVLRVIATKRWSMAFSTLAA
jgi:hypothetical protein